MDGPITWYTIWVALSIKKTDIIQCGAKGKGDSAVDIPTVNEIRVSGTAVIVRYYLSVVSAQGLLDGAAPVVIRAAVRWAISLANRNSSCDVIRDCHTRN